MQTCEHGTHGVTFTQVGTIPQSSHLEYWGYNAIGIHRPIVPLKEVEGEARIDFFGLDICLI